MKILTAMLLLMSSCACFSLDYGIDRLDEASVAKKFEGKQLAILTHAAAKSKQGIHLIDFLHHKFIVKKIFAPEHGLRTMADDWVDDGIDETTGLPVISLYKRGTRAPTASDLMGIDAIVIDLQDVGVRYYTYFSTIAEVMKATAPLGVEVILLDRPNLLGGVTEGKVLDETLAGHFIAYHTIPTRHGMTLGELALMINAEKKIGAKLTVIPASGWARENLIFSSDRPWLAPSPALVQIEQVGFYALWGALEQFNLAVGRGKTNELAFRILGAPWMTPLESHTLALHLNQLGLSGVVFRPYSWFVTRALYEGKTAQGIILEWSGLEVRSDELTYKVTAVLMKLFKDRLIPNSMTASAFGSQAMLEALKALKSWDDYRMVIDSELEKFKLRRKPYLLY